MKMFDSLIDCGENYVLFDQNHGEVTPECEQGCPEVDSCEACKELCDSKDSCKAYECNYSEDKMSCSFNGHLTVTDECGPLCQTQNICVKNSTLVDGTDFVLPKTENRRNLGRRPWCPSGFRDRTNGNAYWWWCGRSCEGGKYWTDASCNCACEALNLGHLNEKLAPTIRSLVFDWTGKLDVKSDMLGMLDGACSRREHYHIIDSESMKSQDANEWECGSAFFKHGGKTYSPNYQVKNNMKSVFGITDQDLNIAFFPNGRTRNAKRDAWCGMPSPGATGFEEPKNYWEKCVMENAGYFNTLRCNDENIHAVLGIAAINPNVCYPAHAHLNEEAYWQIGGEGRWKAWTHKKGDEYLRDATNPLDHSHPSPDHRKRALETYKSYSENMTPYLRSITEVDAGDCNGLSKIKRHDHPGGIVHEMSTSSSEYMLMVYWWAQHQIKVPNTKYHFAHYVGEDSCSFGRIQELQLPTGQTIPNDNIPSTCDAVPMAGHQFLGRRTSRLLSDSRVH